MENNGASNQREIRPDPLEQPHQPIETALDETVLADHLDRYLKAEDNENECTVLTSVIGGGCHVYCFPPSQILNRDFWTLVTMGLSGTTMNVPHDVQRASDYQHAEVMCYLPSSSESSSFSPGGDNSWAANMLRSLVKYVARTRCWIGSDHGLPNLSSDPPGQPFLPSSKLTNMILLDPVDEKPDFATAYVGQTPVNYFLVVPLTLAEAQWKREAGAENSIYYIVGNKRKYPENVLVDYVIDPYRQCAVTDLACRNMF